MMRAVGWLKTVVRSPECGAQLAVVVRSWL